MHSAQSAREIIDFVCLEIPDFIPPDLWHPNISELNPVNYKKWVIMQHRVYQTKICSVDERRVIDVMVWPWTVDYQHSTWLLTTSAEDFERASIRKEINSNTTCELTILILSVCRFVRLDRRRVSGDVGGDGDDTLIYGSRVHQSNNTVHFYILYSYLLT